MYRFELPKKELDYIKSQITFSELQERIIDYRDKEYSIVKMAIIEHVSESTISRELRKIIRKMEKVI